MEEKSGQLSYQSEAQSSAIKAMGELWKLFVVDSSLADKADEIMALMRETEEYKEQQKIEKSMADIFVDHQTVNRNCNRAIFLFKTALRKACVAYISGKRAAK